MLNFEQLVRVREIVSEAGANMYGTGGAIDISSLPIRVSRNLERYVKSCLGARNKPP